MRRTLRTFTAQTQEPWFSCPDTISCYWSSLGTWFSGGPGTERFFEHQLFYNLMILCPREAHLGYSSWLLPALSPSSWGGGVSSTPGYFRSNESPQFQEGIQHRISHLQCRDHLRSLHRHCFSPVKHQQSQNPGMRQDTPLNLCTFSSVTSVPVEVTLRLIHPKHELLGHFISSFFICIFKQPWALSIYRQKSALSTSYSL